MTPKLNGSNLNSRLDWRHELIPSGPQSRVVHMFPGIAERFVAQGVQMPPTIVLAGYLEETAATIASAATDLNEELMDLDAMRSSGTHTVQIHGVNYTDCELVDVRLIGPMQGRSDSTTGASKSVRRGIRLVFVQLRF